MILSIQFEKRRKDIQKLDQQIAASKIESEIDELVQARTDEIKKLSDLENSLEDVATGAVDLSVFQETPQESFSWQDELQEIFKPILYELKQLTERPRQIEHLRSVKSSLEARLSAAILALEEIRPLIETTQARKVKKTLQILAEEWQTRKSELESELQLVALQLNEKLNPTSEVAVPLVTALQGFVTGRGLHLVFAILAFIITFIVMKYLSRLLERRVSRGQDKDSRFFARLIHIVFQILTVVMSVFLP